MNRTAHAPIAASLLILAAFFANPSSAQTRMPATGLEPSLAAVQPAVPAPPAPTQLTPPTRLIVVSLADRRLALVENGVVRKIYPVAVGRASSPSPTGAFTILDRVTLPTYYHDGKVIPPGPENPVGTRWIGLSDKGYGIHGTNAPHSIGRAASHGCIRMARRDLEDLFAQVRAGDTVEILAEPNAETAALFGTPAPSDISAPESASVAQVSDSTPALADADLSPAR